MKTFLNFIGQVAIAIAFVVVAAFGTSAWYTHPVEMTVCVFVVVVGVVALVKMAHAQEDRDRKHRELMSAILGYEVKL